MHPRIYLRYVPGEVGQKRHVLGETRLELGKQGGVGKLFHLIEDCLDFLGWVKQEGLAVELDKLLGVAVGRQEAELLP